MGLFRLTTLITPADSYDLITVDQVKTRLGIADTDTQYDDMLADMVSEVSGSISRYCNRSAALHDEASFPVESVSDLFYLDRDPYPYQVPGGQQPLQVSHWPITQMTSVTQTDPPGSDTVLVEGSDFITDDARGQLIRLDPYTGYPTRWAPLRYLVTYAGGFVTIPREIQTVAIRWSTSVFLDRERNPNLRSREQPGLGVETFWVGGMPSTNGVPNEYVTVLDLYRVPVTA